MDGAKGSSVRVSVLYKRIDIPAGTSILLTAKADKELREVTTQPRKGVPDVKPDIKLSDDRMMFQTRFDNVRSIIDVTFKLIDTDNVVGLRHVVIKAQDPMRATSIEQVLEPAPAGTR